MSDLTLCKTCETGDGISGTVRAFKTKYGYRAHLLKVHGLKEKDGKLVKVRPRRNPIRHKTIKREKLIATIDMSGQVLGVTQAE